MKLSLPKTIQPRMAIITKTFEMCCAHQLLHHDGKCKDLHGHNYRIDISYEGEILEVEPNEDESHSPKEGMVLDFYDVKTAFNERVFNKLDHQNLNDHFDFSTTAENIAWWIFDMMGALNTEHRRIWNVTVYETPTSSASVNAGQYNIAFSPYKW